MSKYKEIKGFKVQTLASDTAASAAAAGLWSSGGSLNQGRAQMAGMGTLTAGIVASGRNQASPIGSTTNTELYNGTNWTEVAEVNQDRYALAGAGTQTAGLIAGGRLPPSGSGRSEVESWNGSSWTETTEFNVSRAYLSGNGTQTAMIIAGGSVPGTSAKTETWNGSSWTQVADLNEARIYAGLFGGPGSVSNSVLAGGYDPSAAVASSETWDGSSWTEGNDLNTARDAVAVTGIYTNGLVYGGGPSYTTKTESYDGTSYTEVSDLSTAVGYSAASNYGTTASAFSAGGFAPGITAVTEEWSAPSDFIPINLGQVYYNSGSNAFKVTQQSTPAGTWASGGNLTVAKGSAAGAGTQTAGIFMGGRASPPPNAVLNETELYNGTSWTEVNNLNTGRYSLSGANSGSQTATLAFGGYDTAILAITESWDGTNWTEVNDLNTAGSSGSGFGTQPAAIFTGGDNRSYNKTESWDGTSWTETTDLNTARAQMAGFGLATAGLICGGDLYPVTSPTRLSVQTELWNGSSWTEVNDLNTGRRRIGNGGFGTQTSGLTAGGYTTTYVANTESWNGTSWTEQTEIQTRDNTTGIGSGANSGLIAGGGTSPGAMSNATEEWVVPEENQTITVS